MASLWKHPKSKFWTACWNDQSGRRFKRTTKTTEKRLALRIAQEFEEVSAKARTSAQVRKVVEDMHKRITGEELPTISLRGFVELWLTGKKHCTKPSTVAFYKTATGKFLAYMKEAAEANIVGVTKQHLDRFRSHEAGELKLAPKTVNHDLKCLKMLFKAAKWDGYVSEDVSEFVETVRETQGKIRSTFTLKEIRQLIEVASPEWKCMITVGLYTGQRLGDVARLRWGQVDLIKEEIRLVTAKTNKPLVIPLALPLRERLMALPSVDDPDAYVHPQAAATILRTGRTGGISNQFANILAAAGLRERQPHRKTHGKGRAQTRSAKGLSFHSLRHTANTLLKEAGIPDAVVQALIGHDDRSMSDHYTHIGRDALRKAASAFPSLT
ncbi:MAG: tyrosine-type recombinase/integrase [Verrucomicrobiales bacterium]